MMNNLRLVSRDAERSALGRRAPLRVAAKRYWRGLRQPFQQAGAVAQLVGADAHAVEQGQPEVVQRRLALVLDVPAGLQAATALAGDEDRQVVVRVPVAVADRAAVRHHAAVE